MRVSILAVVSMLYFFLFPIISFATIYYVDASGGLDTNSGKAIDKAWQTVLKVNQTVLVAGDQVKFKRGEVWKDTRLTISSSGTAGNPIVIGAYPDDNSLPLPLLDGTTTLSGGWSYLGTNIYSKPMVSRPHVLFYEATPLPPITTLKFTAVPGELNPGAILLQLATGFRSFWATSTTATTVSGITFSTIKEDEEVHVRQVEGGKEVHWANTIGTPQIIIAQSGLTKNGHWYWNNNTLYLYSEVNPGSLDISAGKLASCILLTNNEYVTVQDIGVRGANYGGIFLSNSSNNIIQRTKVIGTGVGSHKTGILLINSSGNTITANVVEDVLANGIAAYSWDSGVAKNNVISLNTISGPGGPGIGLSTEGPSKSANVSANMLFANTINKPNRFAYDSGGIYMIFAGSNTIRKNIIRNCGSLQLRSSGIMADWGTAPLVIDANNIENCSNSGVAVTDSGHVITGNMLTNNGSSVRESGQIALFRVQKSATNMTITGNKMRADKFRNFIYAVDNGSTVGHTIDYNNYIGGTTKPFYWGSAGYLNFKSWQTITGNDKHSSYRDSENSVYAVNAAVSTILLLSK